MAGKRDLIRIFEDIDEKAFERMPEWFIKLREAYIKKHQSKRVVSQASQGPV